MRETIGHYRVLEQIGSGGIGEVYRGRDTKQGRTVAIKAVSSAIADDAVRREAFLADARATARLTHPNLATLYEIVEETPDIFLVFDFAAGESLRAVIAGHPLNPRRAVDLAVQVADALADAHVEEVVHGDLQPDNIVVTPRGNAKVLDIGLSHWTRGGAERMAAAGAASSLPPARSTTVHGTVAYLSPEQAAGERGDARTDIFSLGVILFEMLTGKLPFGGASAEAVAAQIARAQAPSVRSFSPALPAELDAIVSRALSKNIEERYESAATLAAELRSVAAILDVRAAVAAEQTRPVRSAPRGRGGIWPVIVVLIALIAAAAWWWLKG